MRVISLTLGLMMAIAAWVFWHQGYEHAEEMAKIRARRVELEHRIELRELKRRCGCNNLEP